MRRAPLEVIEELAAERFGKGASISLDRVACGSRRYGTTWVVRAWNPKGFMVRETQPAEKRVALREMRAMLEAPP